LILVPNPAKTWDIFDIGPNIERARIMMHQILDKVFSGTTELVIKTKNAVREVLDSLFDEKLVKLLYQIQTMIDKNLKQINTYIQEQIDLVYKRISDLVTQIADRATQFMEKTIDEIKKNIIGEFFKKAEELLADATANVIKILDKVDAEIYGAYCSAQTLADSIINKVVKLLPWVPNPWNACRLQLDEKYPGHNLRWKSFAEYTENELYEYRKCDLFINFTEKNSY